MLSLRVFLAVFLCVFTACAQEVTPSFIDNRDSGGAVPRETSMSDRDAGYDEAGADRKDAEYHDAMDDGGIDAVIDAEKCSPGGRILTDDVTNARDLGGVALPNGASVACGVLYRGGQLVDLSAQGCKAFAVLGIRTVIDLRDPSERDNSPTDACIETWARVIQAPMPIPNDLSPDDYLADLYAAHSITAAFNALGDEAAYPIYINCVYGRDRTGVLAAVILLALGATREDVFAEYQLTREAGLSTAPESLIAVLDEIDRLGGVETYLARMKVSKDDIATLRARAIAR
jgi:protein tyrosine/serine phosphatase